VCCLGERAYVRARRASGETCGGGSGLVQLLTSSDLGCFRCDRGRSSERVRA
jgi:hypothetical protein